MPTPRNKGRGLDDFNAQLRANEAYRAYLRRLGANPDGPLKLSSSQRAAAERWVRAQFPGLAEKFQIDPAGNVNTDHGLSTAWSNPYFRYPLIAAGAVGTAGALGAFGGAAGVAGGAGSGAAGGVLPSSQLAMSPLYTGPIAGASQGISAGLGAGAAGAGADFLGAKSAAAAGGAGSGANRALGGAADAASDAGMTWWQQAALAGLSGVPSLIAAAKNKPSAEELALQQQIRDSLAAQQRRFTHQNPLFEAVTQLAMSRLPTASQRSLTPLEQS